MYFEIYKQYNNIQSDETFFKNVITSFYYAFNNNHIAFIKNNKSIYVATSIKFAQLFGTNIENIIGKSDQELSNEISKIANIIYHQDRNVEITRKSTKFLYIHQYNPIISIYIFHKFPIINPISNNVLGTYCIATKFTNTSMIHIINKYQNIDLVKSQEKPYPHLTKREKEVLFCVANGLTDRKHIANFLSKIHGKSIGADTVIKRSLANLYKKLLNTGGSIYNLYEYATNNRYQSEIPQSIITANNINFGAPIQID